MSEKVEIVAELKDLISGKFAEINKQIDTMDGKLSNVNKSGGIMGQVLGANLLTGAISRAGGALTDFAKESFRAYGEAEQFQVALTTLLYGNADAANALNNQLKQFALSTPFELTEIQDATRLMIAYGSSAGGVVDEMRMLGDVAAGTGQPLKEIAYLYGTVRTQGVANLIDLRQFANRGIPIFKELAKVTKYTSDQIVAGGKDIDITFKDVEKAFRNMAAEGSQFGGLMEKQSKTLLGQTSNLADSWEQLKANIGQSQQGILKSTIEWAAGMISQLNNVAKRGNFFDEATKGLQGGFKANASLFSQLMGALGMGDDKLGNKFLAYNQYNLKETRTFSSEGEREGFLRSNEGKGFQRGAKISGEEVLGQFSDRIYGLIEKATSKPSEIDSIRKELNDEKKRIQAELQMPNRITSTMAANQLAIIDKAFSDIKGLKDLNASKPKPTDASKEVKAKDLETVAKGNRPQQIIVNITNLVNELTNVVNTPKEAKQVSAEEVSKVLLGAVNDIYAVAQ